MTVLFLFLFVLLLVVVSGLLGAAIRTQSSIQQIVSKLARETHDTNTIHGAAVMREEAWKDIRLYLGCLI